MKMETYNVVLMDDTDEEIGRIMIKAVDWLAADKIAQSMFRNNDIWSWVEDEEDES